MSISKIKEHKWVDFGFGQTNFCLIHQNHCKASTNNNKIIRSRIKKLIPYYFDKFREAILVDELVLLFKDEMKKIVMKKLDHGYKRTEQEPTNDEESFNDGFNTVIDEINVSIDKIS